MVCHLDRHTHGEVVAWFQSDRNLHIGDFVYFRKGDGSVIKGPWSLGQVAEVSVRSDLVIRRVKVRYSTQGLTYLI
jgi:hypothetical protein